MPILPHNTGLEFEMLLIIVIARSPIGLRGDLPFSCHWLETNKKDKLQTATPLRCASSPKGLAVTVC